MAAMTVPGGESSQAAPPLLRARMAHQSGDRAGAEAALREELAANPRSIPALLAMADLKRSAGDRRAATSYARTALNQAALTPPPPAFAPALEAARAALAEDSRAFEAQLEAVARETRHLPRVAHALDLLAGRVPLHLQQPSMFYFPGLPQRAFYDREEFPWLAAIEAETEAMAAQARALLDDPHASHPYVETPVDRPAPNNPLRDDPSWSAAYLWRSGVAVAANAARAPAIMAALEHAPMPVIRDRSPMALLSILKPGTHIQPHHGMLNTRLIVHVPLLPAPDCGLRVGHETRSWEKGRALVFDDSFEHEAWNRGPGTRVILLFEIWRPEIGPDEREALTRLFETIDVHPAESGGDQ
jgi:aspartyl/asparaginyl beta-hydroxylase (cupin superfamily)